MTRCSNRLALLLCAAMAMAPAMGGELRGRWQSYWLARSAAQAGPLALAHALLPAIAAAPASSGVTLAQVQGSAVWGGLQWHADVVAQAERPEGGPGHSQATVMEGYAAGTLGNWQWSLGRKVVGWDVGYGFRPNDVVQQEVRRLLVAVPLQGRPVLMAERYTPDAAWSLVAVNPTTERSATGAREPALAARWYQRLGAADAYAFARWGQRTRGSLGAAFAWVVSDALELHGSLRHMAHFDTWEDTSAAPAALALASPWRTTTAGAAQQALLGGTWTNAQQVSVLLEAWYDGTAPSAGQWRQWAQRGEALQRMASPEEMGDLVTEGGYLSQAGADRLTAALVQRGFAAPDVVKSLYETLDPTSKAIIGAMSDTAPLAVRVRQAATDGRLSFADPTGDVVEAYRLVERARKTGEPVTALIATPSPVSTATPP